ncbi:MAG TPA: TonB-dependent receptor plug domain-containing protein, partial [Puia sp.]|nr:TonB-dependent receptor plug domain-containing protein [Puia sp.]
MRKFLSLFAVLVLLSVLALAQNKTVTGRVTDLQGQPVPFASITIKGTKLGTTADVDGIFSIKVNKGNILVVSGATLTAKEVPITETSQNLQVQVARQNSILSEVIVTALGVKRQPKQVGYSTARIGTEELTQAKVTNIATGLAAKVSGLQINLVNNGVKPDTRITLRGNRSILGNNQALLVVDDIQLPITYINSLSPNDVDNVTVLKGASASALYGSAASNGVIIITTKKGTKGKPQIVFNSTVAFEKIAYTPDFQNGFGQYGGENNPNSYPGIVLLPTSQYVYPGPVYYVPYENQSYGPAFNGQRVPLGPPIRVYNADGTFSIKQDYTTYSAKPEAKKGFFNTGLTTINNLSYSAGDEKSRFYLSFEDVNTSGVIPKDKNRRNTIRINGSRETGIFRADYNIGYSLTHTNTTPGSGVPFNWGTTGIPGGYAGGGSYFQNRPVYWTIINTAANI